MSWILIGSNDCPSPEAKEKNNDIIQGMIHEIKQGYKEYLCLDDSVVTRDPSTNNGVVTQEKGPIQLHQQPPEQGYNVS